ncbi:MAG: TrkH family potassium uptake protein, partial [Clostridia bacterium]|nr:TrkH family potassium uptake protein [Clostridia bacterium]
MNYKMVFNIIGRTLLVGAILLLLPLAVGLCYGEMNIFPYVIPMGILVLLAIPCVALKIDDKSIYAKEGFVIVAFCWIILSLVGALPLVLSNAIPNYIDAVFETVSGFSTTGATVLSSDKIDALYLTHKGVLFWRSFTHYIGGMGVLVFVLALFPGYGKGTMHVFRAESPGPSSSKFVSKIKRTAMLLYSIYTVMTVLLTILLMFSGIGVYDSVLTAFATAGTGGFAPHGASIAYYNSAYVEMVVSVFMFLFGVNFNLYYFILIGNVTKIFKSEEFRTYLIIVLVAIFIITLNILHLTVNFTQALRYSVFQVTSLISTTGFTTTDFNLWPSLSKAVIIFLMIFGACGGSTGGGIKISRLIILCKSSASDIEKMVHPRAVLI